MDFIFEEENWIANPTDRREKKDQMVKVIRSEYEYNCKHDGIKEGRPRGLI